MSYATKLAKVKAALDGVSDVGNVYDYLRFWTNESEFRSLFEATIGGTKQIRGWMITRAGIPANTRAEANGRQILAHRFQVRGFMSLSDGNASEKTFQALVESVIAALDESVTLSGSERGMDPAIAPTIGLTQEGKYLCHYVEIEFTMAETLNRTYT